MITKEELQDGLAGGRRGGSSTGKDSPFRRRGAAAAAAADHTVDGSAVGLLIHPAGSPLRGKALHAAGIARTADVTARGRVPVSFDPSQTELQKRLAVQVGDSRLSVVHTRQHLWLKRVGDWMDVQSEVFDQIERTMR